MSMYKNAMKILGLEYMAAAQLERRGVFLVGGIKLGQPGEEFRLRLLATFRKLTNIEWAPAAGMIKNALDQFEGGDNNITRSFIIGDYTALVGRSLYVRPNDYGVSVYIDVKDPDNGPFVKIPLHELL